MLNAKQIKELRGELKWNYQRLYLGLGVAFCDLWIKYKTTNSTRTYKLNNF